MPYKIAVVCPRKLFIFSDSKKMYTIETTLLKLLGKRDHKITFFTPIDLKNDDLFSTVRNVSYQHWSKFDPEKYDILFIINGRWANLLSCDYIIDAYNVISRWSGSIIYSQNDPDLYLIYNAEKLFGWESKQHYKEKLETKPEEIFKNIKKIIIWCNAAHVKKYREKQNDTMTFYQTKEKLYTFRFVDLCRFECYYLKDMKIIKDYENKGVYVGNIREGRNHSVDRLLKKIEKRIDHYGNRFWPNYSFIYKNYILFNNQQNIINKYAFTVQIYEERYMKLSSYCLRHYHAIFSGIPCFIDKNMFFQSSDFSLEGYGGSHDIEKYLLVNDSNEIKQNLTTRNKIMPQLKEKLSSSLDLNKELSEIELLLKEAL